MGNGHAEEEDGAFLVVEVGFLVNELAWVWREVLELGREERFLFRRTTGFFHGVAPGLKRPSRQLV
jgi:hypothetical protein